MTIFQGLVNFGQKDEDFGGNSFQWGRLVSKAPKTIEGEPVQNAASIMIYGARGFKPASMSRIVLIGRGVPGLYDFVDPDCTDTLLEELGLVDIKELPEIPVIEAEVNSITPEERKERRKARMDRRRASMNAQQASTPVVESVEEPA